MSVVRKSSKIKEKHSIQNEKVQQVHLNTDNMAKVLIIGETGSGKSTLINYLTNYFRGGSLDNLKVAIPSKYRPKVTENFTHSEKATDDPSMSQTQVCRQYLFKDIHHGNKEYFFLDAPGFGDVNGLKQDEINIKNIIDAVIDLGGLSIVILVINGTNIRLTSNIRIVLHQLWNNFPDAILKSVIVVLTNVQRHTINFDLYNLKLDGNVYPMYMQNSAFSSPEDLWTPGLKLKLQEDWDNSMNEIQCMITIIDKFQSVSVEPFKMMIQSQNKIKSSLHDARMHSSQILQIQDEIHAYAEKAKQCDDDKDKFKHFTKQIQEKSVKIPANYHSTICSNCNYVCHDGCHLEETTKIGDQVFRHCVAFVARKICRSCPQRCDYTQHYHDKVRIVIMRPSRTEIIQEIKSKYDQATKNKDAALEKINTHTSTINLLQKALAQQIKDIEEECKKLQDICSNYDFSNELLIMTNQIETESLRLHSLESKQQVNDMIRSLKDLCNRTHEQYATKRKKPKMKVIDIYRSPPTTTSPQNTDPSPQLIQETQGMSLVQQSVCNQDILAF